MLQSLGPALGCGVMMLVCMAVMAMSGARKRRDQPPDGANVTGDTTGDVAALRDEVARLRAELSESRTDEETNS